MFFSSTKRFVFQKNKLSNSTQVPLPAPKELPDDLRGVPVGAVVESPVGKPEKLHEREKRGVKRAPGWLGYIGDDIAPKYMGDCNKPI